MLGRFASTEIKFLLIKVGLSTVVQRFFESKFQSISFFLFWNIQKRIFFEKGHLVLSKMAPRFKRE